MKRTIIWVAGDPIEDVYLYTSQVQNESRPERRLNVFKQVKKYGGADNTVANLRSLVSSRTNIYVSRTWGPVGDVLPLHRLITNECTYEYYPIAVPVDLYYKDVNPFRILESDLKYSSRDQEERVLVISDYNKGMLNKPLKLPDIKFKYIIVDSRYRSLNTDILSLGKTTVWRCTADEYDYAWGKQFDFVIQTNHANPVWIGSGKSPNLTWVSLEVPPTLATDTTGAGDTFTAAVAAYLATIDTEIDLSIIIQAAEFAIQASQEVIQKPYCAVTSLKV